MIIRDELDPSFDFASKEIISILHIIKVEKQQLLEDIKKKINNYEQKKKAGEAYYQSLSTVRKFFASRPPSHHQAVEYIVHVKERIKRIDRINRQLFEIEHTLTRLSEDSQDELVLSSTLIDEIKKYMKMEDLQG